MITVNNLIAVKPYENTKKIETKIVSGFARIETKVKILKMLVKAPFKNAEMELKEGDFVFVKESDFLQKQIAQTEFSIAGIDIEVQLIPAQNVIGVEHS